MHLLRTLSSFADGDLRAWVIEAAASGGLTNLFNLSALRAPSGEWFATLRAQREPGERPFRAYMLSQDGRGATSFTDLTELNAHHGVSNVADPKLALIGGDVYVTFNSGFTRNEPNDLYLQRITPALAPPRRCQLERRQLVEKNWAFFLGSDGHLRALYAASPELVVIRADGGLLGDNEIHFEREWSGSSGVPSAMSIGTQLLASADHNLLVLHRKLQIRGRRAYLGYMARFEYSTRGSALRVARTPLAHSLPTLLPARSRPNRNLISATYFSGISRDGTDLVLSYGINDIDFGVARIKEHKLWQ